MMLMNLIAFLKVRASLATKQIGDGYNIFLPVSKIKAVQLWFLILVPLLAVQEMLLVGRAFVGIARRDGNAVEADRGEVQDEDHRDPAVCRHPDDPGGEEQPGVPPEGERRAEPRADGCGWARIARRRLIERPGRRPVRRPRRRRRRPVRRPAQDPTPATCAWHHAWSSL